MSLVLALLAAQVGAMVSPGAAPPLPHETQIEASGRERRASRAQQHAQAEPAPAPPPGPQQACADMAEASPGDAQDAAEAWLAKAVGPEKAVAGECLGIALSRQEQWDQAQAAFLAARDAANDRVLRARLGAMAGNAALARGDAGAALAALDTARADAGDDKAMLGDIALDRARALVALKRNDEAAMALDEARADAPGNAQAWLLSATLSRRMNRLGQAQAQIQKAAELLPIDPEIGLEAGVIAVLAGRDEAARKSWQSVIAAAPDSPAAATARGYIAQLGPAPAGQARPAASPVSAAGAAPAAAPAATETSR